MADPVAGPWAIDAHPHSRNTTGIEKTVVLPDAPSHNVGSIRPHLRASGSLSTITEVGAKSQVLMVGRNAFSRAVLRGGQVPSRMIFHHQHELHLNLGQPELPECTGQFRLGLRVSFQDASQSQRERIDQLLLDLVDEFFKSFL